MPTETETATAKAESPTKLTDSQLLTRIRKRFCLMAEADRDNRVKGLEDFKFLHVPGEQTTKEVKDARGSRPNYEFNKSRIKAKRISNEMRANRPAGKVRAVEDSDKSTASVIEGLGRNILSVSDFDTIADYAGEYQVGAGMGAWRIVTEYADESFDQDVIPKAIPDPFNLYWDPASTDPMHRDAEDWVLLDSMSNAAFEEKYGDLKKTSFEDGAEFTDQADWRTGEQTRICEYHWKEPYDKRLVKLDDGKVLDASDPAVTLLPAERIKATRIAKCHKILMCTASGDRILTQPEELKGKYHRFIVVHGEWKIVEGKVMWCGGTRYAKDAQRAYNTASTAITETIATAPNSHYWVTADEAKGNTDQWNKAIAENLPFLTFNPDGKVAGGRPTKTGGADVPVALIQEQAIRDQELKDVWGVYDSSLGDRGNESSGRAIARRTEQGQIVNFNFPDNMAKAKQRTVEIINDLIPFYYDTARTVRVLGIDGAEEYVKINTAGIDPKTGERVLMNDLTRGKYDTTVTVGPSYATQRQEAAETYAALAPQDPMLMATAGDLVYKSMDTLYSDEIAERRAAMLPPQIQALKKQGKELSPEVRQAQQLLEAGKAQLQEQAQLVQAAADEAKAEKIAAEQAKAAAEVATANVRVEQAKLDTKAANIATQEAKFRELIAGDNAALQRERGAMEQEGASVQAEAGEESIEARLQSALAKMQQMLVDMASKHAAELSALHNSALQSSQPQVIVAHPPKRKRIVTQRVGDGFVSEVEEVPHAAPAGVQ